MVGELELGRRQSGEKSVQVFSRQTTHQFDRVFFGHQSNPIVADSNAEVVAGSGDLLEICDFPKVGSGFDLFDCEANAVQEGLIAYFFRSRKKLARKLTFIDGPEERERPRLVWRS